MAAQAQEPLATPAAPDPTPPLLPRPSPSPDAGTDDDKDHGSRHTKRRRTCLAALQSLETTDNRTDCSFSFHARSVAPIDTTPKFGSFNPVLLLKEETTTEETEKGKAEEQGQGAEEHASDSHSHSQSKNEECTKTDTDAVIKS